MTPSRDDMLGALEEVLGAWDDPGDQELVRLSGALTRARKVLEAARRERVMQCKHHWISVLRSDSSLLECSRCGMPKPTQTLDDEPQPAPSAAPADTFDAAIAEANQAIASAPPVDFAKRQPAPLDPQAWRARLRECMDAVARHEPVETLGSGYKSALGRTSDCIDEIVAALTAERARAEAAERVRDMQKKIIDRFRCERDAADTPKVPDSLWQSWSAHVEAQKRAPSGSAMRSVVDSADKLILMQSDALRLGKARLVELTAQLAAARREKHAHGMLLLQELLQVELGRFGHNQLATSIREMIDREDKAAAREAAKGA